MMEQLPPPVPTDPPTHAKICNNCREFMILFPYHEPNERLEVLFNKHHRNHMVVVIDINEVDLTLYKRFDK